MIAGIVPTLISGQPVISSRQVIEGFEVYKDFKSPNLYYYAPGKLSLATETNGRPRFQLVEMRYTGTACTDDQGEQRFLNLAQFTVKMSPVSPDILNNIRKGISASRNIKLKPVPIRYIDSYLVTPVGKDAEGNERQKRIGNGSSTNPDAASGPGGSYWTERTFTLKLENYEAELLWNQISTGKLAVSFGYAFYADAINGNQSSVRLSGDSAFVSQMENAMEEANAADTTVASMMIRSDAFGIAIDVNQWPDALKKLDVNEGVPPAYPALQVACYDFSDALRPDLALKKIEVEAIGVGGQPLAPISAKFNLGNAEANFIDLKFPFAVRMDRPMRYRITEFTTKGERSVGPWLEKDNCSELIDITTAFDQNKQMRRTLELEVDAEAMDASEIAAAVIHLNYTSGENPVHQTIRIDAGDELPLKALTVVYHKEQPFTFRTDWETQTGETIRGGTRDVRDSYYYFSPPENTDNK